MEEDTDEVSQDEEEEEERAPVLGPKPKGKVQKIKSTANSSSSSSSSLSSSSSAKRVVAEKVLPAKDKRELWVCQPGDEIFIMLQRFDECK